MVAMPRGPGMLKERPVVVRYTEALRALEDTLDVPLLDLVAAYDADMAAGGDRHAWFHLDELHPSPAANGWLAERMLEYLDDVD